MSILPVSWHLYFFFFEIFKLCGFPKTEGIISTTIPVLFKFQGTQCAIQFRNSCLGVRYSCSENIMKYSADIIYAICKTISYEVIGVCVSQRDTQKDRKRETETETKREAKEMGFQL